MHMHIRRTQEEFMRYRIRPTDTLASVTPGEKRYDEKCADHAREVLRAWVQTFDRQEDAAPKLGVDQSTLSRNLKSSNQPQLKILIPLARHLKWSLDQVFGLTDHPPVPPAPRLSDSEVNRVADRLAEKLVRKLTPPTGTPRMLMPPPAEDEDEYQDGKRHGSGPRESKRDRK